MSWGHRKVGVQLRNTSRDPSSLSKRTIVEVERIKSETLESLAQRLVKEWIALIRAERTDRSDILEIHKQDGVQLASTGTLLNYLLSASINEWMDGWYIDQSSAVA